MPDSGAPTTDSTQDDEHVSGHDRAESIQETRNTKAAEQGLESTELTSTPSGRIGPVSRRTLLKSLAAGSAGATVALSDGLVSAEHTTAATEDSWTVVALPDTQHYATSESSVEYAEAQTEWIRANTSTRNIAFVSHEGDVVDSGDDWREWERMDEAIDVLDNALCGTGPGTLAYGVPPGDHDWAIEEQRSSSTELYEYFFGPSRYEERSWYGGSAPNGLSHYQFFSAGGFDFLHISLEWEAPGTADDESTPIGWAQSIMDQYPDYPTILTTHSYLWKSDPPGRTTFIEENDGNGNSGEEIWQEIIEPNPQVFLVLCGNFTGGTGSDRGEYHQVSMNGEGYPVYEMLANYQTRSNGGNGFLRLVEFIPGGGTGALDRLDVETYSPAVDRFQTDEGSQFHFDLEFSSRLNTTTAIETIQFEQGDNYTGTVDTLLQEDEPTADNSTASTLIVDANDPHGSEQAVQSLLRFEDIIGEDPDQIPPDTTISSALLTVETTDSGDGASVHRMLTSWSDEDTWDSFGGNGVQANGTEATSTPDMTTGPVAEGKTTIDVTEGVQSWIDGLPNHGWVFLPSGGDGWDFSSSEGPSPPVLHVNFQSSGSEGSAPAAPSDLTATAASSTSIELSWTDNAMSEDTYEVEREIGGTFSRIATLGANETDFVDTGLSADTTYTYRVRAINDDGASAYSNEASATTDQISQILEDFEQTDPLSAYGGDRDAFEVDTATATNGDHSLHVMNSSAQEVAIQQPDASPTIEQGGTYRYDVRVESPESQTYLYYFVQPGGTHDDDVSSYRFSLDDKSNNPELRLYRKDDGVTTEVASTSMPDLATGKWYTVELSPGTDDIHVISLLDSTGSLLAKLQHDTSEDAQVYRTGGFGWGRFNPTVEKQAYFDYLREV